MDPLGSTATDVVEVVAAVALFAGLAVTTVATIGVLRFSDPIDAIHAASMASATGVLLVLLATIGTGDGPTMARAALVAALVLVTATVEGHAVVQEAAHRRAGKDGPAGEA